MIMTYISDDAEYIIGKEFEVDTIIRSNGRNIEGTIVATVTDLEDGDYDLLEYTVSICEKSGVHTKFIPSHHIDLY